MVRFGRGALISIKLRAKSRESHAAPRGGNIEEFFAEWRESLELRV